MKGSALGLSSVLFVLLSAAMAGAQEPPQPATNQAPSAAPLNPYVAPSPAPSPATPAPNSAAQPGAPVPQYPYPPTGYEAPFPNYAWGQGAGLPPKEIPYTGGPIPFGYSYQEKYNLGLLVSGPILFALGYAIAISSASSADSPPSIGGFSKPPPYKALYIPVTGPFAFAGYVRDETKLIYGLLGIGQTLGVGLFLGGILRPKEVLVRRSFDEAFRPQLQIGPGHVQLNMRF